MNHHPIVLAIHGGAESMTPDDLPPEKQAAYREGLEEALAAGYARLEAGGSALDAVEEAVVCMEENPLFNAGRGAQFTQAERHELDAAIACGRTLETGSVACVQNVRNPIRLARAVMERTPHVFLISEGAEAFAREQGFVFESDAYFFTEEKWEALLESREEEKTGSQFKDTVGAAALDRYGNLAAATSTGGLTNQYAGRVGDTALIGAGTYANNQTCAVSCTGDGEFILRGVAAYDLSCLIEYRGLSLAEAARIVIHEKLKKLGGEAGLIAVNTAGNVELVFNSSCMFRGWRSNRSAGEILIF